MGYENKTKSTNPNPQLCEFFRHDDTIITKGISVSVSFSQFFFQNLNNKHSDIPKAFKGNAVSHLGNT
jgi:hypothetical protein